MIKRFSCINACILGWGWHPTQEASPHILLLGHCHLHSLLVSLPEQGSCPPGQFSPDPNSIHESGRSEIVNNRHNFLCCHDTLQGFAVQSFGETKCEPVLVVPSTNCTGTTLALSPCQPAGDMTDRVNSLRRTCASCSFLLTYKNSPKPGEQCQTAALVLHLSIPAGTQIKQPGCSEA